MKTKTLCEFGTCKKTAKIQTEMTHVKTKEKRSPKICRDHLAPLLDTEGYITNFRLMD